MIRDEERKGGDERGAGRRKGERSFHERRGKKQRISKQDPGGIYTSVKRHSESNQVETSRTSLFVCLSKVRYGCRTIWHEKKLVRNAE